MPRPSTWMAALVLLLTCGAGTWVLPIGDSTTRWVQALDSIAANLRPGDCVVVMPSWNEDGARALRHASVPVMSLSDPEIALAAGCTRAWTLATTSETAHLDASVWSSARGRVGDVEVTLVEAGGSKVRALDLWPTALVEGCTRNGPTVTCDAAPRFQAAPGVARAAGLPHACLRVTSSGAGSLQLRFPGVPVEHGLRFTALRERTGSAADSDDVEVRVESAGVPLLRHMHPVSTAYARLSVDARPTRAPLDVVITTHAHGGSICLDFFP